jgi:hypothetical protein
MGTPVQSLDICNICYRCREYVSISDEPEVKHRIRVFSKLHQTHPHGLNPDVLLPNFRCVDDKIDAILRKK